jgi:membrane protease subunit HflK
MEPQRTEPMPEPPPFGAGGEEMAAASRSLSDALRLSFRLLSLAMIVVLGLWALSGLHRVRTGERGVRLLFGRVLGDGDERVVGPGLRWSFPQPIGGIETLSTRVRSLVIKDFWMHETPEEVNTPLDDRTAPTGGLRPGRDGALLTGDRALLHVKFTVKYYTGTRKDAPAPDRVIDHLRNVRDGEELLRSAVCNAAIRAAAHRTVEAIVTTQRREFAQEVRDLTQHGLNALGSGMEVSAIEMQATVPLAALKAFNDVISARQERAQRINDARAEANEILFGAAGEAWRELIGDPELAARKGELSRHERLEVFRRYVEDRRADRKEAAEKQREMIRRFGLLNLYAGAREEEGKAQDAAKAAEEGGQTAPAAKYKAETARHRAFAAEVLAEIDDVLVSGRLKGDAARRISSAKAYRGSIEEIIKAEVERFETLVDEYAKNPELVLHRLWLPVMIEIFTSPTVEKYYLTPTQKSVLRISRDPEAARRAREAQLKAARERAQQETGTPRWSPRPTPPTPSSPPEH